MRAAYLYNTRFPPSFADNGWIYGVALFGLSLVTGLAAAVLVGYLTQTRDTTRGTAEGIINVHSPPLPSGRWTLYQLYRFKVCALLISILMANAPDVVVLLAWREVSEPSMWFMFQADRVLDGLAAIPFLAFVVVYIASGQAVSHALAIDARTADFSPALVRLRDKLGIAVWSLVIATGVTLYKAYSP